MTFPMPFIVPAKRPLLPVDITYVGKADGGGSGTALTIASVPFGAVDPKKDTFLAIHWTPGSSGPASWIQGVTANGVPGVILDQESQAYQSGYLGCGTGLVRIPTPGVTSGSVTVTFDRTSGNMRIATFRIENADENPVETKKTRRGGSLGDLSVTLNVPEGGGAIALVSHSATGGFASPISQDYAQGSPTSVGGSYETAVGNPSLQVQTASGGAMYTGAMCAYAFR